MTSISSSVPAKARCSESAVPKMAPPLAARPCPVWSLPRKTARWRTPARPGCPRVSHHTPCNRTAAYGLSYRRQPSTNPSSILIQLARLVDVQVRTCSYDNQAHATKLPHRDRLQPCYQARLVWARPPSSGRPEGSTDDSAPDSCQLCLSGDVFSTKVGYSLTRSQFW